jgi:hypothetical protein
MRRPLTDLQRKHIASRSRRLAAGRAASDAARQAAADAQPRESWWIVPAVEFAEACRREQSRMSRSKLGQQIGSGILVGMP